MNCSSRSAGENESRIDNAIADFLRAEAAGQAGDQQKWLDRYPDCASCLQEFFDDREQLGRAIMPLQIGQPVNTASARDQQESISLDHISEADTIDLRPEPPKLATNRYKPVRYHAGGGMGEIWLAKDEKIGRQVALKKLKSGRDSENTRFFVEAQITGQLEHPNIVPMHDLGFDDRGSPYYVMKFIRGRRLREAISEFHAHSSSGNWTEDVSFRRMLEVLVSVCNVVAFAHSKGVLHRDIKPDNVMLGPYGETLVVDWGLAKVIGQEELPRESGVHLSSSGSTATQDGAIVGSPYYMSPEGAEGHPEAVDQTSDVYLLGATLYEILTSRPPRHGSSNWELIDLARHSRPTEPRKVNPHVPPAIEAICTKAMSFRKQDRYSSPLELAADVERYLAGAPVFAYPEPLPTRAWRWIRHHQRAILRSTAAIATLLLVYVAVHGYRQAHLLAARELARTELADFQSLADEALFFAANTDAPNERVPYYDPQRVIRIGNAALKIAERWGELAQGLPLIEEKSRVLNLQNALFVSMAQSKLAQADPMGALALIDEAQRGNPPSRSVLSLRSRAHEQLGDRRAAQSEAQQAIRIDSTPTAQELFQQAEQLRLEDVGAVVFDESEAAKGREHLNEAIEKYQAAIEIDPHHYWARYQLGRSLLALGRNSEAIQALSACIAIRPNSPWAYSTRGMAYALANDRDKALSDLNRAIAMAPQFQPARLNRGFVSAWLFDECDAAFEDFAALLAAPSELRLTEAAFYRGQVYLKEGHVRDAIADFDTMIEAEPGFPAAYWERARAKCQLGNFSGGIDDVRTYHALATNQDRTNRSVGERFALGKLLRHLSQQLPGDSSRQVLSRAANELKASLSSGPPNADEWEQYAVVQELLEQTTEAIAAYSRGLEVSPENVRLLNLRGWAHIKQNELELARQDFSNAIQIDSVNSEAFAGRGFVLAEMGRSMEAARDASFATLTGADNQLVMHNVACVFGRLSSGDQRRVNEDLAIAALNRAAALSMRKSTGTKASVRSMLRVETSFPDSLTSRPEFQRLLIPD